MRVPIIQYPPLSTSTGPIFPGIDKKGKVKQVQYPFQQFFTFLLVHLYTYNVRRQKLFSIRLYRK